MRLGRREEVGSGPFMLDPQLCLTGKVQLQMQGIE